MGIYRKNMSAMPNVSGKADKNEAIMQKFGHRKKKISVYAQIRKKRGKETEKLGSGERKNLYMPNCKKLEELPNILESHRTI